MPVNNQTKIADKKNLQLLFDSTTKLARTAPTGRCMQQVKYVGNTDVFCFGFYFIESKMDQN